MYHSTVYKNKELRQALLNHGIDLDKFVLANIKGKPAKRKGIVEQRDNQVKVFGSDFIATGYIKPTP